MKIEIPPTIDAAVASLAQQDALITATEWARAAIVAAYVQPGEGDGVRGPGKASGESKKVAESSHLLSARAFAAEKQIVGLRSKDTVLHYVNSWLAVRDRPTPGTMVDLTGLGEWPPNPRGWGVRSREMTGEGGKERADAIRAQAEADNYHSGSRAVDVATSPEAVVVAMKADPKFAEKVIEGAIKADRVADTARTALTERTRRINAEYDATHRSYDEPGMLPEEGNIIRKRAEVLNLLGNAYMSIRRAGDEAMKVHWDADARVALQENLDNISGQIALLVTITTPDTWDLEHQRLLAEEGK